MLFINMEFWEAIYLNLNDLYQTYYFTYYYYY